MSGWVEGVVLGGAQIAVERYLQSRAARRRIDQLFAALPARSRSAARDWLEGPFVQQLLTSPSDQTLRLAELQLSDVIRQTGAEPPDDLEAIVNAASALIEEGLPAVPELRQQFRELKAQMEAQTQRIHSHVEQVAATFGAQLSELRPHHRAAQALHPRVVELLEDVADPQDAADVRAILGASPSRTGFTQYRQRVSECQDPAVWEALAHYAGLRRWNEDAQELFEVAATCSARPERLWVLSAWYAKHNDETAAAHALLDRAAAIQRRRLHRAVSAFVNGGGFDDVDGLDFAEPDDTVVALVAVEAMSVAGDNGRALALVGRWRDVRDTPTAMALEAELRRLSAVTAAPADRLREQQTALHLAVDAWRAAHDFGLPAPLAARTAIYLAGQLHQLEIVGEVATGDNPHRADELADPEVAAQAQMALEVLDDGRQVEDHLSAFYRRLFELARPAVTDVNAPHPNLSELRSLLELASTPTETARALLAMAHAGHLDDEALQRLREEDPDDATIVEAAHLSATGQVEAAAAKVRPLTSHHRGAAVQLVHIYDAAGRPVEAAAAALDVWGRHADPMFLTHAAGLLADHPDAPEPVIERLRNAVTGAQSRLDNSERVSGLLESLVVIHLNRAQFSRALTYANALHDMAPSDHSRWRIATCEVPLGNHAQAWRTLIAGGQLPQPRGDIELRLLAVLVDSQADQPVPIEALLGFAADALAPDIKAVALLACQRANERCGSPDLGTKIWQAIEQFVQAHPDSDVIHVVKFDESDPMSAFAERVPSLTDAHREFDRQLLLGRIPYTLATVAAHKSPAELLNSRGRRPLHSASDSLITRQRQRQVASGAVGGPVSLDITALHVLGELQAAGASNLAAFVDAFVPSPVAQDVAAHANDSVGVGVIVPTYDPTTPAVPIALSEEERDLQARRQQSLADVAARLRKEEVTGPLTVMEDRDGLTDGEYVAWSAGEAAHRLGTPVWADDHALREMLQATGVPAFGTRALADALHDLGLINDDERQAVRDALRDSFVSDLPATIKKILERVVAGASGGADVLPMRLRGWWQMRSNLHLTRLDALFSELERRDPDAVADWFGNACVGLRLGTQPEVPAPAMLLLWLLDRVPELRRQADDLVRAANDLLWCVPAQLGADEIAEAAELLVSELPGVHALQLVDEALGASAIGDKVRSRLNDASGGHEAAW